MTVALTLAGGTENVTSIRPADRRRVLRGDDTARPRIDPAWPVASSGPDTEPRSMLPTLLWAITVPDREPSRIVPTLSVIRRAVARGTVMS